MKFSILPVISASMILFAQESTVVIPHNTDVYLGIYKLPNGQPAVKFVLSPHTEKPTFNPTRAYLISPETKYSANLTPDYWLPSESLSEPIWIFKENDTAIPKEKLPAYFATVTSTILSQRGLAKTADESLPYYRSVRILWQRLIGQGKD